MAAATLAFSAVLATAAAVLFAYIAQTIMRREVQGETSLANTLYAVWWAALALSTVTTAAGQFLGAAGAATLELVLTLTFANIAAITVALWGLLYYLLYLFTGRRRLLWPLTLFYSAYYVVLVHFIVTSGPVGVIVDRWRVTLSYEHAITGPYFTLVLLLLVGPQILAAFGLVRAARLAEDPLQRLRTRVVGVGILVWFGAALVASLTGLSRVDEWQIVSRIISLVAATGMLLAYAPPRWLEDRLLDRWLYR